MHSTGVFEIIIPHPISDSVCVFTLLSVCWSVCLSGTEEYLPPELFVKGEYQAGPATVWSLGVTLFYMVCAYLPFNRFDEQSMSMLHFPEGLSSGAESAGASGAACDFTHFTLSNHIHAFTLPVSHLSNHMHAFTLPVSPLSNHIHAFTLPVSPLSNHICAFTLPLSHLSNHMN